MKDNKQLARNEMNRVIRELYNDYRLPHFNISDEELDIFFDVTSKAFSSEKRKEDYHPLSKCFQRPPRSDFCYNPRWCDKHRRICILRLYKPYFRCDS